MRIIVGLTSPTTGTAQVLGRRFADLPNPGLDVGVLLDASAQHAGRTGREVLTVARKTMGLPASRVEEMFDLVGLTEAEAARRVGDYSLGMRQRLGLAHALLGDPEVLILDEPANGLDPAGIRWMRDLLRGYADRGSTVLLSSHLLHEIEVVADDLVVIGNGRIVARAPRPSCSQLPAPRSAPASRTSSKGPSLPRVSPTPTPPRPARTTPADRRGAPSSCRRVQVPECGSTTLRRPIGKAWHRATPTRWSLWSHWLRLSTAGRTEGTSAQSRPRRRQRTAPVLRGTDLLESRNLSGRHAGARICPVPGG
jgi:ABC-type Na+ transport system ATPase subunit NatA